MTVFLRGMILEGFKTFARRTEVHFESGLTAIVGPNGSGKTNIIDAFKWVLGEGQARDLRGTRMEDVIYSGGARRPRASTAEVTLLLDNGDRRLPTDYAEVAISRRVNRTGQSDFFINGSRVRRRDILDLLQSTGLTVDSYALVSQADIEAIVTATPGQRRELVEEAASIRGVKMKRLEAVGRLDEVAENLSRLTDLRAEIEPRLESVRSQAEAARAATAARDRLEILRGSIAWEEWREARDAHRRAESQTQSLGRRLAEARAVAEAREAEFRQARQELAAAQSRQAERQERLGVLRLRVSKAEHDVALVQERIARYEALASAAGAEDEELARRAAELEQHIEQAAGELASARAGQDSVPSPPPLPLPADPADARDAARAADSLRQQVARVLSELASATARRELLEASAAKLKEEVDAAEAALPLAEATVAERASQARDAEAAAAELRQARAEISGLEASRPPAPTGLRRVGDVLTAEPGYEAALSATLGSLIDAWVAKDEAAADALVDPQGQQATVLFPVAGAAETVNGDLLLSHTSCERGYEALAETLLKGVVVGGPGKRQVTLDGIYQEPGLIRAGDDPRARLDTRRRLLLTLVPGLEAKAADLEALRSGARAAEVRLSELRSQVAARAELERMEEQAARARTLEQESRARVPGLQAELTQAEESALALARALEGRLAAEAEHRAEVRRIEVEQLRWKERLRDCERRIETLTRDVGQVTASRESRARRRAEAAAQAGTATADLTHLQATLVEASQALVEAEGHAPAEEAEVAEEARQLVALEEGRLEAVLKASALEGELGILGREMEVTGARVEELKARMPEGRAPEDVPGGKAREREMRSLERVLAELGPTNPLAEAELSELEQRYGTLLTQLDDIAAARADLEQLIGRLREEESARYAAVFEAVATNFQDFFEALSGGGRATLREVSSGSAAEMGVELLVQPPRKRVVQNVTLLSSGERSMAALALVLALEAVNPSPFTILDEVDAALDDSNVGRYVELLQKMSRERQFLVVTHNYRTMAGAEALYGVHLDESGCSHLVSARLEDIRAEDASAAAASA